MLWMFSHQKSNTTKRPVRRTLLAVETLQDRVLPSASPVLPVDPSAAAHVAATHGHAHQHFTFALSSTTTHVKGRAEVNVANGVLTNLNLHVQRGTAAEKLSVFVVAADGTSTAVPNSNFTLNSGGAGKLSLKKLSIPVEAGKTVLQIQDSTGAVVAQGTFHLPSHSGATHH
jgi:hypothetical protein